MTTQHQIDLLPEGLRAATRARAQASRNITTAIAALVVTVLTITHARIMHSRAESQLRHLTAEADAVIEVDRQREQIQKGLDHYAALTERYYSIEMPLPFSRLLATIVDLMPESMALDRLHFDADQTRRLRPTTRSSASRLEQEDAPPRVLVCELAGIAVSDIDIAQFVENLDVHAPFRDVTWEFSRETAVRGRAAREFRLSFIIDLEQPYEIHDAKPMTQHAEATDDAQ